MITPPADAAGSTSFTVEYSGLRIHANIEGHGPPLLLVMGLGGSTYMWRGLRDQLTGFTTIAFDAPGTGESTVPHRPLAMAELATIARRVGTRAGYRHVDVLGYSFGGAVAQQMALQSRSFVRRLCLVATTTGVVSVPTTTRRLLQMMSTRRYESREYFREVAPDLFGGRTARDPAVMDEEFMLRHAAPPSVVGYWAQMMAISTWTSLPFLPLISQPTLVLAGDDDRLVPLGNAELLACGIRNARLHVLDGAGHLLLMDEPARSSVPIQEFLRG